jgi:hypothetical protein
MALNAIVVSARCVQPERPEPLVVSVAVFERVTYCGCKKNVL